MKIPQEEEDKLDDEICAALRRPHTARRGTAADEKTADVTDSTRIPRIFGGKLPT